MASLAELSNQTLAMKSWPGGFCRVQQSSFGSSGRPSRHCHFLREVVGRWLRFAGVVELQSINGKGRIVVRVRLEGFFVGGKLLMRCGNFSSCDLVWSLRLAEAIRLMNGKN